MEIISSGLPEEVHGSERDVVLSYAKAWPSPFAVVTLQVGQPSEGGWSSLGRGVRRQRADSALRSRRLFRVGDEMWCGARFGYTADCGCCDPQTGNACPQCGSQSWGWFATAPNNSLITARDAGTEESYALDWESRLAAQYPLPLEGLQGRIHCIDLLGDGFFLGSQSLDAGQLLIDAKLALRQLLERRLQVLFNASVWCRRWGAPAWACGCWGCRCNRRFVRVAVLAPGGSSLRAGVLRLPRA